MKYVASNGTEWHIDNFSFRYRWISAEFKGENDPRWGHAPTKALAIEAVEDWITE